MTIDSGAQGRQALRGERNRRARRRRRDRYGGVVTLDGLQRLQSIDDVSDRRRRCVRTGDSTTAVRHRLERARLGCRSGRRHGWRASSRSARCRRLLAIALAVLGLGGVLHTLLLASRRRRHDFAVVTALGFTRRQVASTVRWQGVLTAVRRCARRPSTRCARRAASCGSRSPTASVPSTWCRSRGRRWSLVPACTLLAVGWRGVGGRPSHRHARPGPHAARRVAPSDAGTTRRS